MLLLTGGHGQSGSRVTPDPAWLPQSQGKSHSSPPSNPLQSCAACSLVCQPFLVLSLQVRVLNGFSHSGQTQVSFFHPHQRTCSLILERGREEQGGRTGRGGTSMCERNINWLPLVSTLTGDGTRNPGMCPDWNQTRKLLLCRMSLQPTEPHRPGPETSFSIQPSLEGPHGKCLPLEPPPTLPNCPQTLVLFTLHLSPNVLLREASHSQSLQCWSP